MRELNEEYKLEILSLPVKEAKKIILDIMDNEYHYMRDNTEKNQQIEDFFNDLRLKKIMLEIGKDIPNLLEGDYE